VTREVRHALRVPRVDEEKKCMIGLRVPHGGVRPVHQKSTCITQLALGPYVVQIWSRNTLELGRNETLVLHRAGRVEG